MYKIVETEEERALFRHIYQTAFEGMNYNATYEENLNVIDILVVNNSNEFAGTLQFNKFSPQKNLSTLENSSLFLENEIIANADKCKIYEIEKLAVAEADRKNGTLDNIVETIYRFTKENDIHYIVAEMNPVFFRALRVNYGLSPLKISKLSRSKFGKYSYQPTILVMEDLWLQYEKKKASLEQEKGITV